MWTFIQFSLIFGSGAFLFARWQWFAKEPTQRMTVGTLIWTYLMLSVQYYEADRIHKDHKESCRYLEKFIVAKDPEAMEDPDFVDEWQACYRHTEEYLEAEADAKADAAASK